MDSLANSSHTDALEYPSIDSEHSEERMSEAVVRINFHTFIANLQDEFEETDALEDLCALISGYEQVLEQIEDEHEERPGLLTNLSVALVTRFERTNAIQDLDQSVAIGELAAAVTPKSDELYVMVANNLSSVLLTRISWTRSLDDIDKAIAWTKEAIDSTQGTADQVEYISNLGNLQRVRFEKTGSKRDIENAIETSQLAVSSASEDDPLLLTYVDKLALALESRALAYYSKEDLDRSFDLFQSAAEKTDETDPEYLSRLNAWAAALWHRFESSGEVKDLDKSIAVHKRVANLMPLHHEERPGFLNDLSMALQSRFAMNSSVEDINQAVEVSQTALGLIPRDNANRPMYLSGLGTALLARFIRLGRTEDLTEALQVARTAMDETDTDEPEYPGKLSNLASCLLEEYERTGLIEYVEKSITLWQEALERTSESHPPNFLSNLAAAYSKRSRREGNSSDLDLAISNYQRVVRASSVNNPKYGIYNCNLGEALQARFDLVGSMNDLDEAIIALETAVASTIDGHINRGGFLMNLGVALESKFERTGDKEDLEKAILTKRQALTSTAKDHSYYPGMLNNLSNILWHKFEEFPTDVFDDIDEAAKLSQLAISMTPESHPDRAMYLCTMGLVLQHRYDKSKLPNDIEQAITIHTQAVQLTPKDHPALATQLFDLGGALKRKYDTTNKDLDLAVSVFEQAYSIEIARPWLRIKAADFAAQMVSGIDNERANRALKTAVTLLPLVSPRVLTQKDQQDILSEFSGLTSRAVSIALECGDELVSTLHLAELGKGVIANLQIEGRSDLHTLWQAHPGLAQRFEEIRNHLDRPELPAVPGQVVMDDFATKKRLTQELAGLLKIIREQVGFARFLLGPSEAQLKSLAGDDTIVMFNLSHIRGDAFVITKDYIRLIRLDRLSELDVEDNARRFVTAVQGRSLRQRNAARQDLRRVLEWLWDSAVGPILTEAGIVDSPQEHEHWPRIWWVASGLLTILPIHAAGYHDLFPKQTAIDRAVSSYVPTVKSLEYVKTRLANRKDTKQRALLIGMPHTRNHIKLPFVEEELQSIQKSLSTSMETILLIEPTRADVMSSLAEFQIIHLACHGFSSEKDPSQSRLLLKDWEINPFTISDFGKLNLSMPQFAFLSACQTAASKHMDLLDESLNLASAVQLAGFFSVVATLWYAVDKHTAIVASNLYDEMLNDGKLEVEFAAKSLNIVTRRLRESTRYLQGFVGEFPSDPLIWASYIHIGV